MASDLSRTGPVERDIEQVCFLNVSFRCGFNFMFCVFFQFLVANVGKS